MISTTMTGCVISSGRDGSEGHWTINETVEKIREDGRKRIQILSELDIYILNNR